MKLPSNLGMLLLAIFLIVFGVTGFMTIQYSGVILAILAIVAGVLLLLGR
jgi:hypothetical protein